MPPAVVKACFHDREGGVFTVFCKVQQTLAEPGLDRLKESKVVEQLVLKTQMHMHKYARIALNKTGYV